MLLHLMPVLCSYNVSDKTNLEQISFFEELKKCSVFLQEIGVLLNKTTQAIDLLLEVEKCFCKKKSFSGPINLQISKEKTHTFGVEKCYVFEFEDSNSCNDSSSSQCESSTNADDSEESTSKIKGSRKINGTLKTQTYYNKSEKVLLKKSNDMALHKYRNMSIVENLKSLSYRLSLIRKTENYRKSEKYIFKAISKYLKTSTLILHNIEHIYTTEMKAYDEDGSYSLEDLINWEIKNKVEVKETIDKIDQLFDELQPDDKLFEIIKDPSKNSLFSVIDLELKNLKENSDQMKNTKLFVLNVIDKINFDIKEIVNFVNCIRNKLL